MKRSDDADIIAGDGNLEHVSRRTFTKKKVRIQVIKETKQH